MSNISRRNFIKILGAGTLVSSFPAIVSSATSGPRVIVVGGGFAGATAAKYLRRWDPTINVTLIEPNARFHSCILSNLVLNDTLALDDITFSYAALRDKYGVEIIQDWVAGIDATAHRIELGDGTQLEYDRLILAPGVSFDEVPGLDSTLVPHAWKAGEQTTLLQQQLAEMSAGGVFTITIPKAPFRCPPGPYERACLVADYLQKNKPGSRVVVLDANADIVAEKETFHHAFSVTYAGIVDYRPNAELQSVDSQQKIATTTLGDFESTVLNVIPPHRAGEIIRTAGLNNDPTGRWADVNPLSYESTLVPDIHIIGDSQGTGQPKAGHIANAEAKVCADAVIRLLSGQQPYAEPKTNSACYSPITANTATWLTAVFAYDANSGQMKLIPDSFGAASEPDREHYEYMFHWAENLFADTFS